MLLKSIELSGFKSFAKKEIFQFTSPISGIVGPNGSGKSNVAEAFRYVLGEQSIKSMRGRRGEDLIFNGSPAVARTNRASVKLVFDNTSRFLSVDFDEVILERVVLRDGVNEYYINGSHVRLRDIVELLSAANIGASGHHIISQGEADRILNANIRERREMIEDALGLKIYQYKKQEGERKLEKTEENIAQVTALRREVAPHLRFLERQVGKIQKSEALKGELKTLYNAYLKREYVYLKFNSERIVKEKREPEKTLSTLDHDLARAKKILASGAQYDEKSGTIVRLEEELTALRKEKDTLTRELGKMEGQLEVEERHLAHERENLEKGTNVQIPLSDIESTFTRIFGYIEQVEGTNDINLVAPTLTKVKEILREFLFSRNSPNKQAARKLDDSALRDLLKEKETYEEARITLEKQEKKLQNEYAVLQKEIEAEKDESREAEKEVFRITALQSEVRATLQVLVAKETMLHRDQEDFERERGEAILLLGQEMSEYQKCVVTEGSREVSQEDIVNEERTIQEGRRREIERIKIRIEEVGGAHSEEVLKEYTDVKERDSFLSRELEDLEKSLESLRELISELDEKLDTKFKDGVEKINIEFQRFFALLFDGGTARLEVVKESRRRRLEPDQQTDEGEGEEQGDPYEGIEVGVNLPHKRVRSLEMLSGGERALTSIALLFAMSQVNPPPFIILDETDAALDEANSKKYGDMIESLSEKSQLVLITHNRETMSRAGILYGVTMGSDGVSKLLSVKLEEAVAVAK